jgi:hypothetical protein
VPPRGRGLSSRARRAYAIVHRHYPSKMTMAQQRFVQLAFLMALAVLAAAQSVI